MTPCLSQGPEIESLARQAIGCDLCFQERLTERAGIDLAQPRWIGPDYWTAEMRVVIVMLNPGSGHFRSDDADTRFRALLHDFANGTTSLQAVFEHQARDIPNWGRGRFKAFILDEVGLQLNQIALANIAWCATRQNRYPRAMLEACFSRHTLPLLAMLRPDRILLCGQATHAFANRIQAAVPTARVLKTLHYAHRKGRVDQRAAVDELRIGLAG